MNRPLGSGRAAAPHLIYNYLPVQFTADSFRAGLVDYQSAEQLAQLRDELSETHVVVRAGDQIACVPLTAEAPAVGRQEVLATRKNLRLVTRLVQASLVRTLGAWKHFEMRRAEPPTFVSRAPGRDLLAQAAQGHEGELAGLHVWPQYKLDVRMSGPSGCPGIIVGIKTRFEIDIPVPREIGMHGLHPRGHLACETLEPRAADPGRRGGPADGTPPSPENLNGPAAFRSCSAPASPCH